MQMFSRELSTFSLVETRPHIQTFLKHGFYHLLRYVSRQKEGMFTSQKPHDCSSQFRISSVLSKSSFEYNPGATPFQESNTNSFLGVVLGSLEEEYPILTNIQIYITL